MTYSEQLVNYVTLGHLLGMGDAEGMFDAMVNMSNKNARPHCAWIAYLFLKATGRVHASRSALRF